MIDESDEKNIHARNDDYAVPKHAYIFTHCIQQFIKFHIILYCL